MDREQPTRSGDRGAIVLCGGESTRMGRSKAELPFGREQLLQRVVHRLLDHVAEVVVVAAAEQRLPELADDVIVARDELASAGPLAGIAAGLAPLGDTGCVAAYVTGCDVPFLQSSFVDALFQCVDGFDVVVPYDADHQYPLAAVYRCDVLGTVAELLAAGVRRPRDLFDRVRTNRVTTESLRTVDAELQTLVNVNTPQAYRQSLQKAGLPLPDWLTEEGAD